MTGTIINVPTDLDRVQTALPRSLDDTMTIAIMLKRKLEYKNAFLSGNVRPSIVMVALNDLCKTKLYIDEGIVINTSWEEMFNKIAHQESNTETTIHSIDEIENEIELEPISETLIHGYGETHLIDDLANKIIVIAPSENFRPLGIFQDKYSEELNFLTLFFGCNRPNYIFNRFSYQKISQWDIEHESTDFETHNTNIFLKQSNLS